MSLSDSTVASSHEHTALERWLFRALCAIVFWAPLPLASNRAWAWALLVNWAGGMAIVWIVGFMAGWIKPPTHWRTLRWPLYAALAFVALIGLQLVPLPAGVLHWLSPQSLAAYQGATGEPIAWASVSVDRYATLQFLLRVIAYACLFGLTLVLARRARHFEALAYAFVYAGLAQALVGILLHVTGASYTLFFESISHEVARGSFVNRNHYAAFLNVCLAMGIGLMIGKLEDHSMHTWKQRMRWLAALLLSEKARLRIILVIMVIALVLTRSRMGNSSFFASLLITGVAALLFLRGATRATMIFIASLVIIDVAVIGSMVGVEKVVQRIEETSLTAQAESREQSLELRVLPGLHSLASLREFPILGTGAGTFYVVFPKYRPPSVPGFFDHAHNDYAQVAVETGMVGLAAALVAGVTMLGLGIITLARRGERQLVHGIAFGGLMATMALLIHSWTEFNLQIPAVMVAVAIVEALVLRAFVHHRALRSRRRDGRADNAAAGRVAEP